MTEDNNTTVHCRWGSEWLDITKVSTQEFQEYLQKYGIPRQFSVHTIQDDVFYPKKDNNTFKILQETIDINACSTLDTLSSQITTISKLLPHMQKGKKFKITVEIIEE
jgi:hypothetical protein